MNEVVESRIPRAALTALTHALGAERVYTDPFVLDGYVTDDTPRRGHPAAVVFPCDHDEVAVLVRLANEYRLPLVARGAGSGNVGGALPTTPGSVIVSFECMQRVLEFVPAERVVIVESGVRTGEIDALARTAGLFYPPDPGSSPYCRIGGNLAMNAAGPRAVKYGATRDYVLGLRAVAGDGRTLVTGGRTTKRAVGYDVTRLLVGSEGTLALITEVTLRLLPAPARVATLRACYDDTAHACAAVARIMQASIVPSAVEFMDAFAVGAVRTVAGVDLPVATRALLMIEADGAVAEVEQALPVLRAAIAGAGLLEITQARDPAEADRLWAARRSLSHAVKSIAPLKINEDVVVPVPRLALLMARIEDYARRYQLPIVSFGHAGNGNLHVNLMVHPDDADEMARARSCLAELFQTVREFGGAISGEHGIGSEKRAFVPLEIPAPTLDLMRALKRQFDPNGILNPGKIFPDE